jgi:hypothetical protein
MPPGASANQAVGIVLHSVIPADELSRATFQIFTKLDPDAALAIVQGHDLKIYVSVTYSDMSEGQQLRSRFEILSSPQEGCRVFATELFEGASETPFARPRRYTLSVATQPRDDGP